MLACFSISNGFSRSFLIQPYITFELTKVYGAVGRAYRMPQYLQLSLSCLHEYRDFPKSLESIIGLTECFTLLVYQIRLLFFWALFEIKKAIE